jgi:2-hydroxymuconate-semialdehyde hydrolase
MTTATPPVTERVVDALGSPVRLPEVGAGPAVLLLHGSGPGTTGWGAWRQVAGALADRHRVVVPDQAGFGATPAPGGRAGRAVWRDQALAVTDALELDEVAIVGHSMGGAVALSAAAARPGRIARVVAVATMGAALGLPEALDRLWAARPDEEGAREALSLLFDDPALVTEEAVAARAEAMRAGAAAYAPLFAAPRLPRARDLELPADELEAIHAPVLLVHGARDRITPLADAALPLLHTLSDCTLHAFGRCGHVPAIEQAGPFARTLRDFLDA